MNMSSRPSPVIDAAARFSRRSQVALTESLLGEARTPHNGGDGGGEDGQMEKRVTELESNMTKAAFDLAYIRGKIEDMPTKDWVSSKLSSHTPIVLAVMAIGFTVIGFLATR
jgi:hypothetical protein